MRLLTTAVVMNGKPLAMRLAWKVYDGLMGDERVELITEPHALERVFRDHTSSGTLASPSSPLSREEEWQPLTRHWSGADPRWL
jgi:hypothetical protein